MTKNEYLDQYGPALMAALSGYKSHTHPKRVKLHFRDWRFVYDDIEKKFVWIVYGTELVPCSAEITMLKKPRVEIERVDGGTRIVASAPILCAEPSVSGTKNPYYAYAALMVHEPV
jgi:hypothetical protein